MDEDERLDLVDKQHKMLDAFDFKSKAKRQVDDLERLQDVDAVRRYLEMDEDERLDLVDKQHKMLDAFDFKSKAKRQVDDLERLVMTGEYPEESA